jgi:hypothetical protein
MIDQGFKAAGELPGAVWPLGAWPISGDFTITIDFSGSVSLAGSASLLEQFPLAAASITVGNPSRLSGEVNLLDVLIGTLQLQMSGSGTEVALSGGSTLTLQIPKKVPLVGGVTLAQQAVDSMIRIASDSVRQADTTASFKILFASFTVRVDLVERDISVLDLGTSEAGPGVMLTNYRRLDVFGASGGGPNGTLDAQRTLSIPPGQTVVIVRVVGNNDVPDFDITFPDGTTYAPEDAPARPESPVADVLYFDSNPDENEAYYALNEPAPGLYTLNIVNDAALGGFTAEVLIPNESPTLAITAPATDQAAVQGQSVQIAWDAADPDSNAELCLFYDSDDSGEDGSLITCELTENDAAGSYAWTIPDGLFGPLHIYGRLDDGATSPVFAYGSGRFVLPDPARPSVPTITSVDAGDGTVSIRWADNDPAEDVDGYRVHLDDNGQVHHYIALGSPFELDNLANGRQYRVALSAINADDAESEPTDWTSVTPSGTSTDGPPDLAFTDSATFTGGTGTYEIATSVQNLGEFSAYSYEVACYYDAIQPQRLIGRTAYPALPPQTNAAVQMTWDTSDPAFRGGTHIHCLIDNTQLEELSSLNNTHTFAIETTPGDFDVDGDVDVDDLLEMRSALRSRTQYADDVMDIDGDGRITIADYRLMLGHCTRPRCARD